MRIQENKLFVIFCDLTSDQQQDLHKVGFPKQAIGKWKIQCEFKDGSIKEETIEMNDKEFMNQWRRFRDWFIRIRTSEIQDD